ncbi:MAG TPA: acyloxyacyl hydrolase [Stellaceae bacterium]|nr:acyloxyacyl hydrolase [Stellaceae bacterium]
MTYNEMRLGVWAHDPHALGGKEHGADLNLEWNFASPVSDDWAATVPSWIRWALQPRPTIGGSVNTAGGTDQFYVGANWSWKLVSNIFNPDDGIVFGYFFGPGFNDGHRKENNPNRKALGSLVLFRESADIGYQFNSKYQVSLFIDHISNGGLAKYNQSINDIGVRLGVRF